MKNKKAIISGLIISIILMLFPLKIFAWTPYDVYDKCNIVNLLISILLIIVAISILVTYIMMTKRYIKNSKEEKQQKTKTAKKWLIITIIQIIILLFGAFAVREIGMEWYWNHTGERFQINEIDGYISNAIRIVALIFIIMYIVTSIIYFKKSQKENTIKIINLVKWQIVIIAIVASLLTLARNW